MARFNMEFARTLTSMPEATKMPVDVSAVAASVVAWLGVLNTFMSILAFAFTVIWLGIRIFESSTVQNFLQSKKNRDDDILR